MSNKAFNNRKSKNALRTIGEVSEELNVLPHVLRFWEGKFSQIKPQKRRGGHRYYNPQDVETIQEIKSLLYDRGFTIKGAQKYLKEEKKNEENAVSISENKFELSNYQINSENNHSKLNILEATDINNLKSILDELLKLKKLATSYSRAD